MDRYHSEELKEELVLNWGMQILHSIKQKKVIIMFQENILMEKRMNLLN